jgi:hypothetical protein
MDLTARQDWLVDRLLEELQWRASEERRLRGWPCVCWLCLPGDFLDEPADHQAR